MRAKIGAKQGSALCAACRGKLSVQRTLREGGASMTCSRSKNRPWWLEQLELNGTVIRNKVREVVGMGK